ncbi:hypothetical protein DLNHIDIE_03551 [Acidithiobacillus thiooxidans ATCC 19377]|uniref:Uncharacterized protein n=1 Tax=Acidithiobacillus thiooxidans ATCC 19377 TaxID=637390 RepID=A0A543PYH4_ACITH|nr:hypothetical protein DLNHIDIE_03551 [Acidithiobacillus thiooxidans ATCC 19377]
MFFFLFFINCIQKKLQYVMRASVYWQSLILLIIPMLRMAPGWRGNQAVRA